MKKILSLMMGVLCLLSCTKQYITEEHIHGNDYCIVDKMFNNVTADASYYDFDNVAIWSAAAGKGTREYGFDTARFIKKDKTNVLHLVRTLPVDITPKTYYDYETGETLYDTTYYWYKDWQGNRIQDYPNDVFNFYIKQESDDEVKAYSRYRQTRFGIYTETVKDTIIDIICPHEEIEREYYYHKYSE